MSLELKLLDSLKWFSERLSVEREERVRNGSSCLTFGVQFLDEALGGIYRNDLILYGARTGIGKTQLATITAMENAARGARVHFFALEAEPNEIERRIKYQVLADAFFKTLRKDFPNVQLNYMDWHYGRLDADLGKVEPEIEAILSEQYKTLSTFYRSAGEFDVREFERQVLAIQDQTDLIIVDHIHYFDFEDEDENRGLKTTVKKIRDLALLTGKPIVLLAHMRKADRRQKQIVAGVDEFHGSSDLTKIATKVVTLAPCFDRDGGTPDRPTWPTYFRVAKCRVDGSRTRHVGLIGFNGQTHRYDRQYFLGRLSGAEDEFQPITNFNDLPPWAKASQLMPEDAR